ncbi:uncharacterized protein G2W53_007659 [Senna tora]|uniref:Uncharacterized protein n=1 Tax=Senna tora TaxID=362788 RepID=A0A835CHG3_9FABA|nr:uncharacterized protein G2W53_007659 [Senna tora]
MSIKEKADRITYEMSNFGSCYSTPDARAPTLQRLNGKMIVFISVVRGSVMDLLFLSLQDSFIRLVVAEATLYRKSFSGNDLNKFMVVDVAH